LNRKRNIRVGSQEDDGQRESATFQFSVEFQPIHVWHAEIGQHTAAKVRTYRIEQTLGGIVCVTFDVIHAEKAADGISDDFFIINYVNG
jgi:hypothetical protein